ncbi:MAG: hypothetical protein ACLR2G_05885 [Phascolarctobacterium faecium]
MFYLEVLFFRLMLTSIAAFSSSSLFSSMMVTVPLSMAVIVPESFLSTAASAITS